MQRRIQYTIGYSLAAAAVLLLAAFALVNQADARSSESSVGQKVRVCVEQRREKGYFDRDLSWNERRALRWEFRLCIRDAVRGNHGHSSSSKSSHHSSVSSVSSSHASSTSSVMTGSSMSSSSTTSNPSSTSSSLQSSSMTNVTVSVNIQNMDFAPTTIFVKKGTTVRWTNNDDTPHTITSINGEVLSSGTINAGDTYAHTFTKTGIYWYDCDFHSSMKGVVVVTN